MLWKEAHLLWKECWINWNSLICLIHTRTSCHFACCQLDVLCLFLNSNNIFHGKEQNMVLEQRNIVYPKFFFTQAVKYFVYFLLVCSPSKLSAAASLHMVWEPFRPAAADDGSQVPCGPCCCCGTALPGSHLLVCSMQQGMSMKPGPLSSPKSMSSWMRDGYAWKIHFPNELFRKIIVGLK